MSRLHDALGPEKAPRRRSDAGKRLGQLGWAPGSRTKRRRESRGLWHYLRRGILFAGVAGVGWWLAPGRDRVTPVEPAAGAVSAPVEPAADPVGPVDPTVEPIEIPVASEPPVDTTTVPQGETQPDESPAPRVPGDAVVARFDDGQPAPLLPVISAILVSEGRRLAVIEGRVLGVGQQVGPWELVSVSRDAVVVQDATGAEQVVRLDHE